MASRFASDAEGDEGESVSLFRSGMQSLRGDGDGDVGQGPTVTSKFSPWRGLQCATCGQTFRYGDPVEVTQDVGVQHLAPELHCAREGGTEGGAEGSPEHDGAGEVRTFTAALLATEAPDGPSITILSAGDWQVARRGNTLAARCAVCAHTFRPGESVIVCPCARRMDNPPVPACGLTVHRDPSVGLDCWEQWQQVGSLARCPVVLNLLATSRTGS